MLLISRLRLGHIFHPLVQQGEAEIPTEKQCFLNRVLDSSMKYSPNLVTTLLNCAAQLGLYLSETQLLPFPSACEPKPGLGQLYLPSSKPPGLHKQIDAPELFSIYLSEIFHSSFYIFTAQTGC